ncbi:hypothetical protein MCAMS1_01638 [biofilm metagenome]
MFPEKEKILSFCNDIWGVIKIKRSILTKQQYVCHVESHSPYWCIAVAKFFYDLEWCKAGFICTFMVRFFIVIWFIYFC